MPISVSNSLGKLVSANLTPVQRNIEESIQKLSTGKRIHKGADDAASMHLASSFETKVKGLTVTISNKKDALSSLYTAEGGVKRIGELLQRMRELTLNAQTDTIDKSQRDLLTEEVNKIKLDINRIGENAQFGGQKLLDGSFRNRIVQVGDNQFQTMNIGIDSVLAKDMQFIRDDLTMRIFSTPYITDQDETSLTTSNNNKIVAGSIFIDGHKNNATINITNGMSAKEFASRVHAAGLGVDASAITKAQLFNMAAASDITFRLGANTANDSDGSGTTISATISDVNNLSPLVTAINNQSGTTGVTAEIAESGSAVTLTDENGDNIFISHMDFTPNGPSHSNNPESNQNEIFARALDKDGLKANVANANLSRGVGTDQTVRFIDKHRNIHVDRNGGVLSVTVTQKGSGYATAPTVTFVGGDADGADASGAGSAQANYSANLVNGKVDTITRTNGTLADRGRGYDEGSAPTINISAPPVQNFNARTSINISNEQITLNSHNFETGDRLTYSNGGGTTLSNLSAGDYFAIKVDNNTIKLASSLANANAGNAINLDSASHSFNTRTAVSVANDTIQISGHNFENGDTVTYTSGGRTLRNLTSGTNYVVRDVSGSSFKLKDTSNNNIDIVGMVDNFNSQSDVNHTTNRINVSGHNFQIGDQINYSTGGGAAIGGLTNGQTYNVSSISGNLIQLSGVDIIARKTGQFNAESNVDLTNNRITVNGGHSLSEGDQVTYTTNSGGTAIGGLSGGSQYFIRNLSGNTFQLSSTSAGAIIDLVPEEASFNALSNVSGNRIFMTNKFSAGDRITYSAGSGTAITGLASGQDYLIESATGSFVRLQELGGGAPISLTAGSSETHTITGQNSGSSETHEFNGPHAGENETHTFTNQYAGPSENHSFKSTQYAGHNQTHTFQGITARATPVMDEDDVPDDVYYDNITQDQQRTALVVGTVTMESPQAIRITGDNATEKSGFFGTLFNYEGMGNTRGESLPPVKTVNDVDLSSISAASKSLDYIDAGIKQFNKVSSGISINASVLSSSISSTLQNLIYAEGGLSSLINTNFAIETTTFTVGSMIKDTSLALLAQANAPKKAVTTLVSNVMETQWDPTFFLVQGGGYRYRNI